MKIKISYVGRLS